MAAARKGTATPLGAAFSPEETSRAVARVAEAVADRRAGLGRLQGFVSDNAALVSLVQRLPDEISHEIMVPFGGAAFFPGRLIHTNELLVLLGEGYYAERSSKQTADILRRRGTELEAQVEAMKATISDLEAEAKFFESTATEASSSAEASSSSGGMSDKDREHARIMARLDELELEEKEAGGTSEDGEEDDDYDDEGAGTSEDGEENEVDGNTSSDENDITNFGASFSGSGGNDQSHGNVQLKSALKKLGGKEMLKGASLAPSASTSHSVFPGQASIIHSEVQVPIKKAVSFQDDNKHIVCSSKSHPFRQDPNYSAPVLEAFTGSIIEHDKNLSAIQPPRSNDSEKPVSSSSRPVSRFKMQKGRR